MKPKTAERPLTIYCPKCGAQHRNWGRYCSNCRKCRYFGQSEEWKKLRAHALQYYGCKCMACGSTTDIQVDHIKPKAKYPHLALWFANLQILCRRCNFAKNTRTEQDWRKSGLLI